VTSPSTTDGPPATATWRLLGVVPADSPELPGVDLVPVGTVAAAITPHEEKRPMRELLQEHADLVDALFRVTTVLPARFGMLVEDGDVIRERLLEPNHEFLAGALEEIRGKIEVTVRLVQDDTAAAQAAVNADPALRRDARRLQEAGAQAPHALKVGVGERIAGAVAHVGEQDVDAVRSRLEPLAVSVRAESPAKGGALLDAAYLVERERFDDFDAAVGDLVDYLGDRASVTAVGPLAPYSFADLQAG
jgi:hypothetical protein